MQTSTKKTVLLLIVFVAATFLTGCTSWKKKYGALDVEHQNLKGLYENCRQNLGTSADERAIMAQRLAEGEQTLEEMKRQIEERNESPFGEYETAVDTAAGTITVTLPNTILFSSGKATLIPSAKTDLNHIVSVLNDKYSGRQIDVVGHTDADPIKKSSWKDNWELSAQRALSVLRQLNANGIPDDRIRAVGCGQGRAIAPNNTSSGKASNRRVEIVVHMR